MGGTEEYEAAGLYEPGADGAAVRLELIEWLREQGFSLDDLKAAQDQQALAGLASDRHVAGGPRLGDVEAAARANVSIDDLHLASTAFGFTPLHPTGSDIGLTEVEADMVGQFTALAAMFTEVEAIGFVRVVGSALGRVAEAAMSLFLTDVESPHMESDGNELELAKKSLEAVGLLDHFTPLLDVVLRRHLAQATLRSRAAMIEGDRRYSRFAVGFIDLVGFTPVSRGMAPEELRTFIRDFEGAAHDAVTTNGARLVKLIGDEVMFVSPDANAACAVARELMVTFRTDRSEVQPRGGLAFGPVLLQGGDYYGEVVNLASRLADTAVPMELLVTEALDEAADGFAFEAAGRRQLKGFPEPVVARSMLWPADGSS